MKILFITRDSERCGVADYGRRLFSILKPALDITLHESDGVSPINYEGYDVALYNYHHATLPNVDCFNRNIKHVALFHEAFMNITPDVIIRVAGIARPLIGNYYAEKPLNRIPVIGSFGFGFPDKNFPGIAKLVTEQFKEARLRLNIPFAEFGDNDGAMARNEAYKCQQVIQGTAITLEVNHNFLSQTELLEWNRANDLNVFLYADSHGRGISSATDYALSVRRPIAISRSEMFKHLPREICVDNATLPDLLEYGVEFLNTVYLQNTNERLINQITEYLNK